MFKGTLLKFLYELVGICRAGSSGAGVVSANNISHMMKVPIRVYNNVSGVFRFCITASWS